MSGNDRISKIFIVAFSLCIVCSVVVSTAAVVLKPAQEANKALDRKRNILAAAGMLEPGVPVEEQFQRIETRVIDLRSGEYTDEVKPGSYEQLKAAKHPAMSKNLPEGEDPAGISRREHFAEVYLARKPNGELDKVILPVRGYGLWSTLYGFLALEADGNTVAGIGFYEHGETPGLGGEVDNPRWKAQWHGKKVYRDGEVALTVLKGSVNPENPKADWQVDGLSGATLTSKGVTNLVHYWLGPDGFKQYLEQLQTGEA